LFVARAIVGRALNFLTPTENTAATNAISFSYPSPSYEFLFYSHIVIAALACLSVGTIILVYTLNLNELNYPEVTAALTWPPVVALQDWIKLDADDVLHNGAYLSTMFGLTILFPLSFGPNILSSSRTFGLLIVFLGPFVILAARLPTKSHVRFVPASVCLVVLLLVTSGFISATITHDVSRVPNFDRERIVEDGDRIEQFALYQVYVPEQSIAATKRISEYVPSERRIYKSVISGQQISYSSHDGGVPMWNTIQNPSDIDHSYIYIGQADTTTESITTEFNGFVYYEYFELPNFLSQNKLYTNGEAKLYAQSP
jgi:hypothetical protein